MNIKKLMQCKIYQVASEIGVIDRNEVIAGADGRYNYDINQLDDIIVYRSSIFNPNKVKEILTDVEFDLGEKKKILSPLGDAYTYDFVIGKDKIDTFVAVPWYLSEDKELNLVQLKQYINKHFNVDEYRKELMNIKSNGFKNRMNKELNEVNDSEDKIIKDVLVKMKKLKKTNFNSMD